MLHSRDIGLNLALVGMINFGRKASPAKHCLVHPIDMDTMPELAHGMTP
jgi:hypothetical protein